MKKWKYEYLEITHDDTGKVVKRLDITGKSEKNAEKIEDGMGRNLNWNEFTLDRNYSPTELKTGDFNLK